MRPYTRSLHPSDYDFLQRWVEPLRAFQADMARRRIPHRDWCPHRFWEYGSILQQLEELGVGLNATLVDVGSGGCFFAPYLALKYHRLCVTDSMKYGDVSADVAAQRRHYGVELPLFDLLCEDMGPRPDLGWGGESNAFDVVMCISTIEHVDQHDAALYELCRIAKPGGLIFITSDYFRDCVHFEASVSRHLQVTPYREEFVRGIPSMIPADFVGGTDLAYRGDFVHNYSFVNICLRKRL